MRNRIESWLINNISIILYIYSSAQYQYRIDRNDERTQVFYLEKLGIDWTNIIYPNRHSSIRTSFVVTWKLKYVFAQYSSISSSWTYNENDRTVPPKSASSIKEADIERIIGFCLMYTKRPSGVKFCIEQRKCHFPIHTIKRWLAF